MCDLAENFLECKKIYNTDMQIPEVTLLPHSIDDLIDYTTRLYCTFKIAGTLKLRTLIMDEGIW